MVTAAPHSVLAHLLEEGEIVGDDDHYPWHAVNPDDFEALHHAWLFSNVMQGASLLYNLLVAQRYEKAGLTRIEAPVEYYEERLELWSQTIRSELAEELADWNLERMWQITAAQNPNIHPQAQRFVKDWVHGIRHDSSIPRDQTLHALVRRREQRKGKQSRLLNEKMLRTWSGAAGTEQLAFRWGTVRTIVNDVTRGLSDNAVA